MDEYFGHDVQVHAHVVSGVDNDGNDIYLFTGYTVEITGTFNMENFTVNDILDNAIETAKRAHMVEIK